MEPTILPEPHLNTHHQVFYNDLNAHQIPSSEKSSSQPLSLLPSPEVPFAPISISNSNQISKFKDSQFTSQHPSKALSKESSYSRVSISNLVHPISQNNEFKITNDRKRCSSPTIEKTLRYKIPKNCSIKYNFNTRPTEKTSLISCLVDLSVMAIEAVRNSNQHLDSKASRESLHSFITQLFRRSQASKAVVQLALVFCLRTQSSIKTLVQLPHSKPTSRALSEFLHVAFCGRRLFLGSLICATKYLQDSNFSNSTWAKIVGIPASDISLIERVFLQLVNYRLFVHNFDFYPYACRILELSSTRAPVPTELGRVVKELFYKA